MLKRLLDNRWLIFGLRLALGGIFVTSSIGKLQAQAAFTDAVLSYEILPHSLADLYASTIPWAELFIGCALVLGIFSLFASALSIPLVVSFAIANIYSFFHPVGETCGECFGVLLQLSHPVALTIDVVMLLMAVLLVFHKNETEFLGMGPWLSKLGLGLEGRARFILQVALVALAMVVTASFLGGAESQTDAEVYDIPQLLFFYKGNQSDFENEFTMLRDLAVEYSQRIEFFAVNYVDDPEAAEGYDVEISPTVLLITGKSKEGGYLEYERFEGTVDREMLKNSFDRLLSDEAG
jgi:uncharacterized membrane protein YphA (DoxX/SURF4 family)